MQRQGIYKVFYCFGIMAAALSWVACSQTEDMTPETDEFIGFGVAMSADSHKLAAKQGNTRAIITGNEFPKNHFNVWGGYEGNTVFDSRTVYWSEEQGWTYDGLEQWVYNTYHFYAVYPATVNATYVAGEQTLTIADYDVNNHPEDDLLIAEVAAHNFPNDGGIVRLNFKHALAAVRFAFKLDGEFTYTNTYKVTNIKWGNVYTQGLFAAYKDALLKPLNDGVPVVQNERMPLTGKQDITVEGGENSRTIQMLRSVGKLSITVYNERDEAITVYVPSLGDFLPHTGYTFKHDDILPQSASNPYHPVRDSESHAVIPNSYQLICETLLYETNSNAGFQFGMSYKGTDYTFQENLSGNLNRVKQEPLLVKLYKAGDSASDGQFLRLEQTADGNYRLGLVTAQELDSQCFWELSSAGKQQRGFTNIHYRVSLNMEDGYGFSNIIETFKYGGTNDYTTIGEGSAQLTYYSTTGEFGLSSNGTYFQFYTYVEENNGGTIRPSTIVVRDVYSDAFIPLTKIYRNQHIRLNIFFR